MSQAVRHTDPQHLRDLEFLAEVTSEALSTLQINALLLRVVTLLRMRFGYEYAAVGLLDGDALVFRAGSGAGLVRDFHEPLREEAWHSQLGLGIAGSVALRGEPRFVDDVTEDPDYRSLGVADRTRSELCLPLVYGDRVIGVLDVRCERPSGFDQTDLHLLQIVCALVTPAIHTARLYEQECRRVRHLRLVNEISRLVMSSLDRDQIVSSACRAMLDALDISFVAIVLLDARGKRIVQGGYAARFPFAPGIDFDNWSGKLGDGLCSEVIRSGEPLRIGDVTAHTAYHEIVQGIRSNLSVPLRLRGNIIGALVIEHTEPHHFTDDDTLEIENIAGYLAQAIDNARLFEAQRQRWEQLLRIHEVSRVVTRSIDLDEIVCAVASEVQRYFGYAVVGVYLVEDAHVELRATATDRCCQLQLGAREAIGQGIAGRAVHTERVVCESGAEAIRAARPIGADTASVICVPLCAFDRVVGALQVESPELNAFDETDLVVTETLAKTIAGAVSNARAVRQTEELRDDLNRMLVHDLRNPVQAVQLTLQEVVNKGQLPPSVVDLVQEGVESTVEILDMVSGLLDVARFEAGRAQLRPQPASINDHVRAAVRRFGPLVRSKRLQVTMELSQEVPVVRVDHDLFRRTLANLVANAIKFTPDGATITVSTQLQTTPIGDLSIPLPAALVGVQDTGEGIPAEFHEKIFEKFGQVESRRAGFNMSSGLGLALCRYVVLAHGGRIWVESQPGFGSTFYVALPVDRR